MKQNYLYCEKCKEYPTEINEEYLEPIVETREWNNKTNMFEMAGSNICEVEYVQKCRKCNRKLKYKGGQNAKLV